MMRILLGAFLLAALAPPLLARDDPKDKPKPDAPAPAETYQGLIKEYSAAQRKIAQDHQKAETAQEKAKLLAEYRSLPTTYAPRFLDLAKKHPMDPAAVDALLWLVRMASGTPQANEAVAILTKDHIKDAKVVNLLPGMVYQPTPANEKLARAILDKATDQEAKGKATFFLAQLLKNKADADRGADRAKIEKEAEALFERAAKDYGDVKLNPRQTIADASKPALFEMKYLAIGKKPPDIEGEDIDGKKFKLSEYRGKVVVLDFWGNW